jgi:hypothetical protein
MASDTQPRSMVHAVLSLVIASAVALGLATSGVGLRHAVAISPGCSYLNTLATSLQSGESINLFLFDAGEQVSVTASNPANGNPTLVQILRNGFVVEEVPFPGTATSEIPSSGVINSLLFQVNTGQATLDFSCAAAPPPTDTPTNTPTETSTNTPTVTETPTETQTPPPGATDTPVSTATPPLVCCAGSPTATVDLGATQTAVAGATETAAVPVIPTEATGPVSELPGTGSGPGSGSGRTEVWLLVALLAVTGAGIAGVRVRRSQ